MPARPTWKGYLKISLVNIPVKVFPATDAAATIDRLIEGLPKDAFDAIRGMNAPRVLDRSLHRKEHLDEIERALR